MPDEWKGKAKEFQDKVDKISNARELGENLQETWDLVESLFETQVRDGKMTPELRTMAEHVRDDFMIKL